MFLNYLEQLFFSPRAYWQAFIVLLGILLAVNYSKYAYRTYLIFLTIYCVVAFGARTISSGTDTESYTNYFNSVLLSPDFSNEKIEYGFYLIAKSVAFLTESSTMFLVVIYVISLVLIFLSIGNIFSPRVCSLVIGSLVSSFAYIDMSTNGIRQGLAVAIAVHGLSRYFNFKGREISNSKSRRIAAVLQVVLSGFVHISTLTFLPFMFFRPTKRKFNVLLFLIVIGFCAFVAQYDISTRIIDGLLSGLGASQLGMGGISVTQKLENINTSDASVMEGVFRLVFFFNVLVAIGITFAKRKSVYGSNAVSQFALFYMAVVAIYVFTVMLPFSYRYFYLTAYPGIFVSYLFLSQVRTVSSCTKTDTRVLGPSIGLALLYFILSVATSFTTKAVVSIESTLL